MDTNQRRQPEDLLTDESFLAWYNRTDANAVKSWQEWMEQALSHQLVTEEAVQLLNQLTIPEATVPGTQLEQAAEKLMHRIEGISLGGSRRVISSRGWWMVAAAAILLGIVAGWGYKIVVAKSVISTPYGQIATQLLPDGTEITLNAHSRLEYGKHWRAGEDRDVWLTGEAFFHVMKTPTHDRFIVHGDHFDVIVTGTSFNVVNQPGDAAVVLKEGSVTVHEENGQEVKMVPGDFVDLKGDQLVKQTVNPADAAAWIDNKINFDNTPISEVQKMIGFHYGVTVEVSDPSLLTHTLNGIFPNDNLEVLLKALEATKEYKVSMVNDKVVIQSPD